VQLLFSVAITPIPVSVARERRGTAQLILTDVGSVANETCIVSQLTPRDGVLF